MSVRLRPWLTSTCNIDGHRIQKVEILNFHSIAVPVQFKKNVYGKRNDYSIGNDIYYLLRVPLCIFINFN